MHSSNQKTKALVSAVKEAGALIERSFLDGSVKYQRSKVNESDIVTNVDIDSERILKECISKHFPDVEIYSEELPCDEKVPTASSNIAVIDPLDGTSNFSLGIPYFSVSVLIRQRDERYAIIYNPITKILLLNHSGRQKLFVQNKETSVEGLDPKKEDYSLRNLTFAVISDYTIPPQTTEPFLQHIYYAGVKRVMSNWSPAHDYLNLVLHKIDCVISLSQSSFSEAAGLLFAGTSRHHSVLEFTKRMPGGDFPITISAHKKCISAVRNLIDKYGPI